MKGLYAYLDAQVADMLTLAENMGKYQNACAEKLDEHIAGLREQYCETLVEAGYSNGEYGSQVITSVAEGVTLGSPLGGYGAAAGALAGFIKGFIQAAEKGATDYFGIDSSSKSFRTSMTELDGGFEIINPSSYFDGSTDRGDKDHGQTKWLPSADGEDTNNIGGKK